MRARAVLMCLLTVSVPLFVIPCRAQVMGDDAELTRLRLKGEEAMANDDPDGAAMMMGRAALLAGQLAKKQNGFSTRLNKGQEALFRSQEHTYRGMALFRRAGGQLPASSGVCGSLALAHDSLRHATDPLIPPPDTAASARQMEQAAALRESADNWASVLESIIAEYQCP
jgi:hypothetical protein